MQAAKLSRFPVGSVYFFLWAEHYPDKSSPPVSLVISDLLLTASLRILLLQLLCIVHAFTTDYLMLKAISVEFSCLVILIIFRSRLYMISWLKWPWNFSVGECSRSGKLKAQGKKRFRQLKVFCVTVECKKEQSRKVIFVKRRHYCSILSLSSYQMAIKTECGGTLSYQTFQMKCQAFLLDALVLTSHP